MIIQISIILFSLLIKLLTVATKSILFNLKTLFLN